MFGHCYKNQAEDVDLLTRFRDGKGTLLDLEFVVDPASGRRVAAFGVSAGFNGAVVGALAYVAQYGDRALSRIPYAESFADFAGRAKGELDTLCASGKVPRPRVHIMGALGRCGTGARQACKLMGLETVEWDMAETAAGGPFPEMLDSEILLNAILLDAKNPPPPFLTTAMITKAGASRRLRIFVDVSCDTSNPTNPVPIYHTTTTFDSPCLALDVPKGSPPLDVVAIDHLPSLVPAESSREFAGAMLPYLVSCGKADAPQQHKAIWKHVQDLYTSELTRVMAKAKRKREDA
jgi:saccharopine dehydrogenase (NAD+, L-lysine-forming)